MVLQMPAYLNAFFAVACWYPDLFFCWGTVGRRPQVFPLIRLGYFVVELFVCGGGAGYLGRCRRGRDLLVGPSDVVARRRGAAA